VTNLKSSGPGSLRRAVTDANNSVDTGTINFHRFRLLFLGTGSAFDFNGNGTVDASDFIQFRLRFLQSV
jgi:hypothetical protein